MVKIWKIARMEITMLLFSLFAFGSTIPITRSKNQSDDVAGGGGTESGYITVPLKDAEELMSGLEKLGWGLNFLSDLFKEGIFIRPPTHDPTLSQSHETGALFSEKSNKMDDPNTLPFSKIGFQFLDKMFHLPIQESPFANMYNQVYNLTDQTANGMAKDPKAAKKEKFVQTLSFQDQQKETESKKVEQELLRPSQDFQLHPVYQETKSEKEDQTNQELKGKGLISTKTDQDAPLSQTNKAQEKGYQAGKVNQIDHSGTPYVQVQEKSSKEALLEKGSHVADQEFHGADASSQPQKFEKGSTPQAKDLQGQGKELQGQIKNHGQLRWENASAPSFLEKDFHSSKIEKESQGQEFQLPNKEFENGKLQKPLHTTEQENQARETESPNLQKSSETTGEKIPSLKYNKNLSIKEGESKVQHILSQGQADTEAKVHPEKLRNSEPELATPKDNSNSDTKAFISETGQKLRGSEAEIQPNKLKKYDDAQEKQIPSDEKLASQAKQKGQWKVNEIGKTPSGSNPNEKRNQESKEGEAAFRQSQENARLNEGQESSLNQFTKEDKLHGNKKESNLQTPVKEEPLVTKQKELPLNSKGSSTGIESREGSSGAKQEAEWIRKTSGEMKERIKEKQIYSDNSKADSIERVKDQNAADRDPNVHRNKISQKVNEINLGEPYSSYDDSLTGIRKDFRKQDRISQLEHGDDSERSRLHWREETAPAEESRGLQSLRMGNSEVGESNQARNGQGSGSQERDSELSGEYSKNHRKDSQAIKEKVYQSEKLSSGLRRDHHLLTAEAVPNPRHSLSDEHTNGIRGRENTRHKMKKKDVRKDMKYVDKNFDVRTVYDISKTHEDLGNHVWDISKVREDAAGKHYSHMLKPAFPSRPGKYPPRTK